MIALAAIACPAIAFAAWLTYRIAMLAYGQGSVLRLRVVNIDVEPSA